jgi:hypothetical protein
LRNSVLQFHPRHCTEISFSLERGLQSASFTPLFPEHAD